MNLSLGGTSRQRFRVNATCAIQGLANAMDASEVTAAMAETSAALGDDEDAVSRTQRLKSRIALTEMRLRVWIVDVVLGWIGWWHSSGGGSASAVARTTTAASPAKSRWVPSWLRRQWAK